MDIAALLDEAIELEEHGRLQEALARFERVLAAEPANSIARAGALGARAAQACEDGRPAEAIALANEALAASNYDFRALTVRAKAYATTGRHQEALADCLRVLTYAPEFAEALAVRGTVFVALGEMEAGVGDLEAALALKPDLKFLAGQALHYAMHLCRWDGFNNKMSALLNAIDAGQAAARPFWLVALPATPQQQRRAAEIYFRETVKVAETARPQAVPSDKIRLGYFSMDFRAHATAHLIAGMFEAHDRSRFEVIGFALDGSALDPIRLHLAGLVDKFIDCDGLSADEIVVRARQERLDIALDLNAHIGIQPTLFARGVAPIQVNYLGYPGTTAADCYDYIIADRVIAPFENRGHFSERVVQLPHCYQPNSFARYGSLVRPARRDLGLPDQGFVFCCFNDSFKILPDVFDVWMRLLHDVDGSVLWLLQSNQVAPQNLRAEAIKRGIAPERLVFASRTTIGAHLGRHAAADLFLDTAPCNAHTTATDSLWAGLPLLTCAGDTFAGRVAASILMAAGLPELVTYSLGDYERRALELARDPAQLGRIRDRLWSERSTNALFDTARYTRNIESAYEIMWRRHTAGMPPEEFKVEDAPRS